MISKVQTAAQVGPVGRDVAAQVVAPRRAAGTLDASGWFYCPAPQPAARLRLLCLPYAAGWPWMFRDWPSGLPDDVEVHAVCLPGRGRRASEPAAASMDELVAALCSVARPLLDRPYAIFGHSFGALVGFELAGALERAGHAAAQRLFVSGCAAPDETSIGPMVHQLSDAELAEVMRALSSTPSPALQDAGVLATTLALFRADLKLAELHRPSAAPLAAPLTAYFGSADLSALRTGVARWRRLTLASFELCELPGDHFFLHTHQAELLGAMRRGLS